MSHMSDSARADHFFMTEGMCKPDLFVISITQKSDRYHSARWSEKDMKSKSIDWQTGPASCLIKVAAVLRSVIHCDAVIQN
jgi:hypothetical protein